MPVVDDTQALERRLSQLVAKYDSRRDTNSVRFALASPSRDWRWEWSSPGSAPQYFIASTTKLYVTALIMQLRGEGRLDLDAPAVTYLGSSIMSGIHVLKGTDSSDRITVAELLSHTSGIADYFEQRRRDGSTQIGDALRQDFGWTFDDVLRITKEQLSPRFAPSTPGKAFYSDTNFQLLGAVVEAITGGTYEDALQERILGPLGLADTYPFTRETIDRYGSVAAMLYGDAACRHPAGHGLGAGGRRHRLNRLRRHHLSPGLHDRPPLPDGVSGRDAADVEPGVSSAGVWSRHHAVRAAALLHTLQGGAADDRPLRRIRGGSLLRPGVGPVRLGHRQPDQEAQPLLQPDDATRDGVFGCVAELGGTGGREGIALASRTAGRR